MLATGVIPGRARPTVARPPTRRAGWVLAGVGALGATDSHVAPGPGQGLTSQPAWQLREERGLPFVTDEAFYRAESCAGRDLAVLAAALHRRRTNQLRVLDVMAGCGMRGARYLVQADADEVWINDGSQTLHQAMVFNLCSAAGLPGNEPRPQAQAPLPHAQGTAVPEQGAGACVDMSPAAAPAAEGAVPAGRATPPAEGCALRWRAEDWEGQAQRLRLEGLARDVWQWELPARPAAAAAAAAGAEARQDAEAAAASLGRALSVSPESGGSDGSGDRCCSGGVSSAPIGAEGSGRPAAAGVGARLGGCSRGAEALGRGATTTADGGGLRAPLGEDSQGAGPSRRIRISHVDANRLLTNCYMREDYYDLIDIDSFGSETMYFPAAVDAVRYGGLLYLTSTDGFTASGKRHERGLAAYGSYLRAVPWANEQGLRMVIGAAVREAASRGVALTPVFSLYSYHGPVFRVMLRARRTAEWPAEHYGFAGHCFVHGDNYMVGWRGLGAATCRCEARGKRVAKAAHHEPADSLPADGAGGCGLDASGALQPAGPSSSACSSSTSTSDGGGRGTARRSEGTPLVLSGPLWTGPLHDAEELRAIAAEAAARGWTGFGMEPAAAAHLRDKAKSSRNVRPLQELLGLLLEEADPRLPAGFFSIDDSVARRMARPPPRDALIAALRDEGFAAARCHLEARAFRTNACMEDILRVAEERLGIPRRR